MKRIFAILPPWVAAFFTAVFMVITPMAYYIHLSSCQHVHGGCADFECLHGACGYVSCIRDGGVHEPLEPAFSQDREGRVHDPATCSICQGIAKLYQVIRCHGAGLSTRLNVVEGPLLSRAMAPFLSIRTGTYPRAPPFC